MIQVLQFPKIILALIIVVQFKDCYSQSNTKNEVEFKKHTLTRDFISEGVAVGDVNKDKKMDILAGAYWFEAPDWNQHEIYPGKAYNPGKEYSNSFLNYSLDVNQDGWIDLVVIGFPGKPAAWFENLKNKEGNWLRHSIDDSVSVGNESPNFVDVDGDGRTDILCADSKTRQMVWLRAPHKGDTLWERFPISDTSAPGTEIFSHGLGFGDVNKDGRRDVIVKQGWWEAPPDAKQPNWTFHKADLGDDCSHMYALDVDGDGKNDVISASAHKFGIWWYEQNKNENDTARFIKHEISQAVSQTHASMLTDINKDGHPDFITGKRFFAHNDTDFDPGAHDSAKIYWFEFTPGLEPYWIPHQIDNDSGVGLNVVAEDINNDNLTDIIISNKKGVFFFENVSKKSKK